MNPGTGKTTTLKALLNALHQREYNRYYDKLLSLARVKPEETPAAWEKLSELRHAPQDEFFHFLETKMLNDEGGCVLSQAPFAPRKGWNRVCILREQHFMVNPFDS